MRLGKPPRKRRADGAEREVNPSAGEGVNEAPIPKSHLLERSVVRQHVYNDFECAGFSERIRDPSSLGRKGFSFAPGPIVNRQFMACLKQIARDRQPHIS
jgi:hypothetical protein